MFERYRAARRRSGSDIQSIFRNEMEISRQGTIDSCDGGEDNNETPRTRSDTIASELVAATDPQVDKGAVPASPTMLSVKGWLSSSGRDESEFTKNAGTVIRHAPGSFTWTLPRPDLTGRIGTTRFRMCSDADACKEAFKGAEVAMEYTKNDDDETVLKLYSMRNRLGFRIMIDDNEIVVNEEAAKVRDKDTTRIPYYLKRTNSGNLPVYTDFRGGKPYTVVTHIRGNMESFVADLRCVLFGEQEDPSMKNASTERREASSGGGYGRTSASIRKAKKEAKDPTREVIVFVDVHNVSLNSTINGAGLGLSTPDDLEALRGQDPRQLSTITCIDLSHNLISSLRGFAKYTGLIELRLSGNRVKCLDGLDGLVHLKQLDLSYNRLTSLEEAGTSLGSLVSLERLELQGNSIRELLGLQQCWRGSGNASPSSREGSDGLMYLDLRDNHIGDPTQLLYISGTGIKQLLLKGAREHCNTICNEPGYRLMVLQTLPNIEVLDGRVVTEEERREARNSITAPSGEGSAKQRKTGGGLRNPWADAPQFQTKSYSKAKEVRLSWEGPTRAAAAALRRSRQVEAVETLSSQNDPSAANRQGTDHKDCDRQMAQMRMMVSTMQEHYETLLREAASRLDGTRGQLEAAEGECRRLEAALKHGEKVKSKQEAALAKDLRLLEADMEKRMKRLKLTEDKLKESEESEKEMRRKLEEFEAANGDLKEARGGLLAKCSELEDRCLGLEGYRKRVEELEKELGEIKGKERGAVDEIVVASGLTEEDVTNAVEAAKREVRSEAEKRLARMEGEMKVMKTELQERKEQIRCQRQAYESLEAEQRNKMEKDRIQMAELNDELKHANAAREDLRQKLDELGGELDREKYTVNELRSMMEERERGVTDEAKQKERLIEELKRAQDEVAKHKKALKTVELEVTRDIERLVKQHEKDRSKQQNEQREQLKALGEAHGKELTQVKASLAAKEKETEELIENLQKETRHHQASKEAAAALRKDLVVACKQLEKEVHQEQAFVKKIQGLQSEIENLKAEKEKEKAEMARRIADQDQTVSLLNGKVTEAERAREAAEALRRANEEYVKDGRRREEELQGKIRNLEELVRKSSVEAAVKEKMVADSADHVKSLKKQLQSTEAELEQLQKERKKRDRDWQALLDDELSKAEQARDKLMPTEEKLAAAEAEVERLREDIGQREESLRYITSEVEEMRRAMQEETANKVAEVEKRLNREHEKSLLDLDKQIEEAQRRNDREHAQLARDRDAMKRKARAAEERVKHVEKELRTVLNEYEHLKVQCEAKMRRAADLLLESGVT
ncbi:hypothetical protein FOL47_004643, partial [Perkinsus chesapeaki]